MNTNTAKITSDLLSVCEHRFVAMLLCVTISSCGGKSSSGKDTPATATGTASQSAGLKLAVIPTQVNFGAQLVGSTTSMESVTLLATGDDPVFISAITSADTAYTIDTQAHSGIMSCVKATLKSGQYCTIPIKFTPKAAADVPAKISISYGPVDGSKIEVAPIALSGHGIIGLGNIGVSAASAKPKDVITLTGKFMSGTGYHTVFTIVDGTSKDVTLDNVGQTSASFVMPDGLGLGLKTSVVLQGAVEMGSFAIVANDAANTLPIMINDPAEICSTTTYLDRDGQQKVGTKACTGAPTVRSCASDGDTACTVDGTTYKAAVIAGTADKILSGQTVAGVPGTVILPQPSDVRLAVNYGAGGTALAGNLAPPPNCSIDGDVSCLAIANFPAVNKANLTNNAGKIVDTMTIAGVTGTLPSRGSWDLRSAFPGNGFYTGVTNAPTSSTFATGTTILGVGGSATLSPGNCVADGASACVVDGTTYKSASVTNLSPGNIKSGVTLGGTLGQYPSANYPLPLSNGTSLTTPTFNAQIKSSATFQYFDSAGARYTGSGDTNLTSANIANGINIFGSTGTYTGVAPNAWDVRAGVTLNGVAGLLKVACRNRVNSTLFNYDNPGTFAIGQGGTKSGTVIDVWDTIDDYNNATNGLPGSAVPSWSNQDCGGIETTPGDANVWKDITKAGTGAATCVGSPENCTMQDKISALWWTKVQTTTAWDTAWASCLSLNYNGQTGWRLPTEKELLAAHEHGMRSAASNNWLTTTSMTLYFWSGTTRSDSTGSAWSVKPAYGNTTSATKNTSQVYTCVR